LYEVQIVKKQYHSQCHNVKHCIESAALTALKNSYKIKQLMHD